VAGENPGACSRNEFTPEKGLYDEDGKNGSLGYCFLVGVHLSRDPVIQAKGGKKNGLKWALVGKPGFFLICLPKGWLGEDQGGLGRGNSRALEWD